MSTSRSAGVALVILVIPLCTGCLYIPVPERPPRGSIDIRHVVGRPRSPVHLGTTSRAQVIELFGLPFAESPDGRFIAYNGTNETGYWFELIWGSTAIGKGYFLLLEFDPQGVARRHAVKRERYSSRIDDGTSLEWAWRPFAGNVRYSINWSAYRYGLKLRRRGRMRSALSRRQPA